MSGAGSSSATVSALERVEKEVETIGRFISQKSLKREHCVPFFGRIRTALIPLFGEKSPIVTKLNDWLKDSAKTTFDPVVFTARFAEIAHFASIMRGFSSSGSFQATSHPSLSPKTKSIFIIHGHDELNWRRLTDALRAHLQLEPIVILARPGQSQTTIEKFENEASKCAYAIALFTPDDSVENKSSGSGFQARPNVIFEAGWFLGRLGRSRLLLLVKDGTTLHSDFAGVNQIRFHEDVTDKFLQIKQELESAGLV